MEADTFTCAKCGNTFEKERSDEEAMQEAKEQFGIQIETMHLAVVCDDCYQAMWN